MATKEDRDPGDQYIGARVKLARARRHVTQKQLAERIGVSHQQLQKYEAGQDALRATRLKRIADVLRFPVSFFVNADQADDSDHGGDAQAREFAEALGSIPDAMIRRRILLFTQSIRDDLAAAEQRIRAELQAEAEARAAKKA